MQDLFKLIFLLSGITIGFSSCQRVIDVEVTSASQQLVIEGNITNAGTLQTVIISRTVPYSSTNIYPAVSGAKVTLVDATGNTYKLPETTTAGTYTINNLRAKPLGLYMLNVVLDGKIYTATSVMPAVVNLDSLTVTGQVLGSKLVKSVAVNYHDPAGGANQYKYVMYVNGIMVKRIFVENDQLTDGRPVTTLLYQRDIELKKGDKVDVEMQCIDLAVYYYWDNLSGQGGNSPSDSSTPANPPTNFNNNILGYFSAHTMQRKSIIIP
jgi:hypothetical protein